MSKSRVGRTFHYVIVDDLKDDFVDDSWERRYEETFVRYVLKKKVERLRREAGEVLGQ